MLRYLKSFNLNVYIIESSIISNKCSYMLINDGVLQQSQNTVNYFTAPNISKSKGSFL